MYKRQEEKYKKDYARSLELIRAERARFRRELEKLPNLRVIPSQANYLMVELLGGLSARAITRDLLVNRCILVKDLSPKPVSYTHLDVYKRQLPGVCAGGAGPG